MFLLQICERSLEHSESIQANWEIVSDRLQWRITWKSMFTSCVALQPEREKESKRTLRIHVGYKQTCFQTAKWLSFY